MKTALLFPGQGSQYIGMGKEMFARFEIARRTFEEASEVLGYNVSQLCFEGSMADLTRTEHAQPCILTASIAAFRVLMEHLEVDPYYCAGHSLGEISALTASGAITFADAVRLVQIRGRFMQISQETEPGGMMAVHGLPREMIEIECSRPGARGNVVISNLNSGGQTVISGRREALEQMGEKLVSMGGTVIPLQVSGAFHSPLMREAAEKFSDELLHMSFQPLRYSVLSNVTARPYPNASCISSLLSEQIVSAVDWEGCMRFLHERETECLIEVGPGAILGNMLRREKPEGCVIHAADKAEDWMKLLQSRGRLSRSMNFNVYLKAALCAKNCNREDAASVYMSKVAEPFRILEGLTKQGGNLKDLEGEHNMAYQALVKILEAKLTPAAHRECILNRVAEEGGAVQYVQYA